MNSVDDSVWSDRSTFAAGFRNSQANVSPNINALSLLWLSTMATYWRTQIEILQYLHSNVNWQRARLCVFSSCPASMSILSRWWWLRLICASLQSELCPVSMRTCTLEQPTPATKWSILKRRSKIWSIQHKMWQNIVKVIVAITPLTSNMWQFPRIHSLNFTWKVNCSQWVVLML